MGIELSKYGIDSKKSVAEYLGGWRGTEFSSGLIESCNFYVKQPLESLTDEGIRLLLSQRIGLEFVVPTCVCYLYTSPFSGGDYEEGALIRELLQVPKTVWEKSPSLKIEVDKVIVFVQEEMLKLRAAEDNCDLDLATIDENIASGLNVYCS